MLFVRRADIDTPNLPVLSLMRRSAILRVHYRILTIRNNAQSGKCFIADATAVVFFFFAFRKILLDGFSLCGNTKNTKQRA